MKIDHYFRVGVFALMLAAPLELARPVSSVAASDTAAVDPGQQKYVRDYVDAVKSGNPERLKALIHPASLACITDQTRDFFDEMLARALQHKLTGKYRIARVVKVDQGRTSADALLPAEMFSYPVRPTHEIQVDFETGPYASLTLIRAIALFRGKWLEVSPCPTAKGLEAFRKAKVARDARKLRAKELVASLEDPLLSEIRDLVKQQNTVEAMKRYSAATGEDLSMAREVVDLLESRSP